MPDDKVGAAILGFRGAIRCCIKSGYDPDKVYEISRKRKGNG